MTCLELHLHDSAHIYYHVFIHGVTAPMSPHKVKPVTLSSLMIQYYAGPTKWRYQTAWYGMTDQVKSKETTTRDNNRDNVRDRTGRHDPPNTPSMLVGPTPLQTTERGANPSAPRRPPHMAAIPTTASPLSKKPTPIRNGGTHKAQASTAEHNDGASCPPLHPLQRPSPRHTPLEPLQSRPTCSRPHLLAKPPKAPSWRQ
jgi:hypothetical protein